MEEDLQYMTFEEAISAAKNGQLVTREGWNGKGMFVYFVPGSKFTVNRPPLSAIVPPGTEVEYRGHFDMKYADGTYGVWLASHGDMTGNDWRVFG